MTFRLRCAAALSLLACTWTAHAGIILNGTRVIYPAKAKEISVRLTNDDAKAPRLIKAWIDGGLEGQAIEMIDAPFTLTPPVARVEPKQGQTLRIAYDRTPLSADHESLFWLNVLEVPPDTSGADQNTLQFAFRTRVKMFFRPDGLPGKVSDAPGKLTWRVATADGHRYIVVHNPTAYHVSFQSVALRTAGKELESAETGMAAPGGDARFALPDDAHPVQADTLVAFKTIDDFGAFIPATAPLFR
jgi:chaperone protein EcpD